MLQRRDVLRMGLSAAAIGVAASVLPRSMSGAEPATTNPDPQEAPTVAHELPALAYPFEALQPHIDARTMQIHHDLHHGAYVKNLNTALEQAPALAGKSAEDLIKDLSAVPEAIRAAVRNNGGGHVNHTMFWQIMSPNAGGAPAGELATAINGTFGSFDAFKTAFNDAGLKRFGSGWVWLVINAAGTLAITSTANQDNPISEGAKVIMGNDVWEHAYYLNYQNRRAEYLAAWWNVVNWNAVAERFAAAK